MEKYQNKYRIPAARTQWWNYGNNAPCFITICTKDKIHGFGEIVVAKVDAQFIESLIEIGQLAFYEGLTTHVARKSYITNSLILGVPERVVKAVSGHKSEKYFRRYVNLANGYKDEMIRNSFSADNLKKII